MNHHTNLVSIITPVHNTAAFLPDCIESVLAQSYPNWELILIDDASTDTSADLISEYSQRHPRIRSFCLNTSVGAPAARNKAISIAKGRFIAFLDSDDVWYPEKLKCQVDFMINNNFAFTCTGYQLINEQGHLLNKKHIPPKVLDYQDMLKSNQVGCLTAMYDVELLGKCYMPLLQKRQDYALWLSILKMGVDVHGIDRVLANYRVRNHSLSRNKLKLIKHHWLLYRQFEKMSVFKSCYYLGWNIFRKLLK